MEVKIDELPVEREIVGYEDGPAFDMFPKPFSKLLHYYFRISEPKMLFT